MHRLLLLPLVVLLLIPGCKALQRQPPGPTPDLVPRPQGGPVPFPGAASLQPVPVPPGPPAAPGVVPPPPAPPVPPAPPTSSNFWPPVNGPIVQPSQGLPSTPPPPQGPTTPQPGAQVSLLPPEPDQTPASSPSAPSPGSPSTSLAPGNSTPSGIPNFSQVQPGIAAGHRPALEEGLDWLQKQGYRKVLHLRLPGEDDSADRKQVEKRGMVYTSLEVSPATLSPALLQEFARMVSDRSQQPLFVYDRDGALAGGLWFLYFRTIELLDMDAATLRAIPLGYRDDLSEGHRQMWLAVQVYLARR